MRVFNGMPSDDTFSWVSRDLVVGSLRTRLSADCRLLSATAFVPHPHKGSSMERNSIPDINSNHIGTDEIGFICRLSGLGWEIELLVEATWLQRSQCFHPKILSAEEGQSDLLFRHGVLVFNFFDYDDSEVLESVIWGAEMLIDLDRIVAFCIVPVLIYSPVGLLRL